MKSKYKILIIENSVDVTGALKSITRTAYDLKDYFDFCFIIPKRSRGKVWIEGKGFSDILELPIKEISRRASALVLYLPFLIANAIRLKKIIRREEIALLHVNDIYNLLPVMYHWLGGKIPYVCHIRFLPDRFPKVLFNVWLRLHLRYANKIITVSHAVARQLPNHEKIEVVHNELPVEEHYPEVLTPDNSGNTTFTFLYLSNFMSGKGQNFAVEAFAKIYRELPNWKLRFVGGNMGLRKNEQYKIAVQERAKALGVFEKIEWKGFTEDVEMEYKLADVVLNFSESESFSITCLEALFFGRPVIATDCGGPAEIIENGKTGILVENRNIEEMAKAMRTLASNEEIRLPMRELARESVRQKFSVETTSYKIRKQYRIILNGV